MKKKIDKKTITLIIIACALAVSTLIISMIAASSNKKPVGDQTLGPDTTPSSEGTIVIHDPGAAVTQKPDSGGGEASPDEGSDKELVLVLEDPSNTSTPSSAGEVAPIGAVPVSGQIPGDDGPGGSSSGHGHTGEYHCAHRGIPATVPRPMHIFSILKRTAAPTAEGTIVLLSVRWMNGARQSMTPPAARSTMFISTPFTIVRSATSPAAMERAAHVSALSTPATAPSAASGSRRGPAIHAVANCGVIRNEENC